MSHVPVRFKTEHDRNHADRNSTDNRKRMQTPNRRRKEFHAAEINDCRKSCVPNRANIGVCEIGGGADAEQCGKRQNDYECGRFPAVMMMSKSDRNVWNRQYEKKPEQHRIVFLRKHS